MQGHVQRPVTIGRSLTDFERVVAPTVRRRRLRRRRRRPEPHVSRVPEARRPTGAGRRRRTGGGGKVGRPARRGREGHRGGPGHPSRVRTRGRDARRRRRFEPHDLDGMWWVVAAAPSEVNEQVRAAAERRQLFVNAVDDPPNATAYLGGVVRRDGRDDRDFDQRPRSGAGRVDARSAGRVAARGSRRVDGRGRRDPQDVEAGRRADGRTPAAVARDVESHV